MKGINDILEKYFEGQTSLGEEKILRDYFQQPQIDKSLEIYRPIFGYFAVEAEKIQITKKTGRSVALRWLSIGVAACIGLLIGVKFAFFTPDNVQPKSVVYINGIAYTDNHVIGEKVIHSLDNISDQTQSVISSQIDILDSFF